MQGVLEVQSSNAGASAEIASEEVYRDNVEVNEAALTVFQNFIDGIVATSLTSTMEAAERASPSQGRIRRSSRLKKTAEVMKEDPVPFRKEPLTRKVRLPLQLASFASCSWEFAIAQHLVLHEFCCFRV